MNGSPPNLCLLGKREQHAGHFAIRSQEGRDKSAILSPAGLAHGRFANLEALDVPPSQYETGVPLHGPHEEIAKMYPFGYPVFCICAFSLINTCLYPAYII